MTSLRSFLTNRLRLTLVAALLFSACFVALAPSPAAAWSGTSGKGCTANVYGRGSAGACVKYIQRILNGTNAAYGSQYGGSYLAVDGIFGANTHTQVQRFQKWTFLAADGIVGSKTWDDLCGYGGQVAWYGPRNGTRRNIAWNAAYDAGCIVEVPTSSPPYYRSISRY